MSKQAAAAFHISQDDLLKFLDLKSEPEEIAPAIKSMKDILMLFLSRALNIEVVLIFVVVYSKLARGNWCYLYTTKKISL